MNRPSRITVTTLAALLATAPVAAFAQSSSATPGTTGSPPSESTSGTNAANPGTATNAPPGGTAGDNDQSQQLSQSELQNVQQQLQQQGFYKNAQVDGKWGPHTRRAVRSFQHAKGLPASGHLDQQTLAVLGVNKQGG
jgi:peptidoglycan hydrolase-like protein with peptidoglycan-binding domain